MVAVIQPISNTNRSHSFSIRQRLCFTHHQEAAIMSGPDTEKINHCGAELYKYELVRRTFQAKWFTAGFFLFLDIRTEFPLRV